MLRSWHGGRGLQAVSPQWTFGVPEFIYITLLDHEDNVLLLLLFRSLISLYCIVFAAEIGADHFPDN